MWWYPWLCGYSSRASDFRQASSLFFSFQMSVFVVFVVVVVVVVVVVRNDDSSP